MMRHSKACFIALLLSPVLAYASTGDHTDPIASVILVVTSLFFFALIGRYLAHRFNQPGVLGELLMGVFLGNLCYFCGMELMVILREGTEVFEILKGLLSGVSFPQSVDTVIPDTAYTQQITHILQGPHGVDYLKIAYVVDVFSRYGVIFLLFMVGLESSVEELKRTGRASIMVALIGVIAPMILGFSVAYLLMPDASYHADLFVAATLSATSIGITARVLTDMKKLHTPEARTILGAAMLDDVLGLIILAAVSSVVISGAIDAMTVIRIILAAVLFFVGVVFLGPKILRKAAYFFRFLELWEAKLFISFLFVMVLAWLASLIQLAAIIGAFAAGVILNDNYFQTATETEKKQNLSIHQLVKPLESIMAPMFFMVIGLQVKLESFLNWRVLFVSSGLILAAILGKLISGLGAGSKMDRVLVGIGMLPRGEVGLVFAAIGRTLGVISDDLFSAIVLMVIVTTFMAPPLLKARYARNKA
jgi:Kef-type K+ transport system membrane component KefB